MQLVGMRKLWDSKFFQESLPLVPGFCILTIGIYAAFMNKVKIILFIVIFLNVFPNLSSQNHFNNNGFIKEDSMNLAILVLDFLSFEFEEANITYYPLCDSCDLDSLPFDIDFMSPGDYGEILYNYTQDEDTLFYASIWWMGTGEIYYPDQFMSSSEFEYQSQSIILPSHVQYYDYWLIPNYYSADRFRERADSAWMAIDSLQIVKEFAENTFRVGIYAYTPSVGMFNPTFAKWIIFIYYGNTFTTGIKPNKLKSLFLKSYPNPFSTSTTFSYTLDKPSSVSISIFNAQGQLIEKIEQERLTGEQKLHWNAEGLPAGMLYYRIKAGDMVGNGKLIYDRR